MTVGSVRIGVVGLVEGGVVREGGGRLLVSGLRSRSSPVHGLLWCGGFGRKRTGGHHLGGSPEGGDGRKGAEGS